MIRQQYASFDKAGFSNPNNFRYFEINPGIEGARGLQVGIF
jgi:hypothetical protein